jgi:hypothetical protein
MTRILYNLGSAGARNLDSVDLGRTAGAWKFRSNLFFSRENDEKAMISIAKPEATISHPPPTPLHLHVGCRRQTLPILREISLSLSLPTPVRSPVQSEAKAPEVRGAVPLTAHRVVELQDPRSAGSRETSTGRIPASRSGHHHRRPVAVAAVAEVVEEEDHKNKLY